MAGTTAKISRWSARYSKLAIAMVLTLGYVFGLHLRQSEGLMLLLLDLFGRRLRIRSFTTREAQFAIGCAVLNRMLSCARPESLRCIQSRA